MGRSLERRGYEFSSETKLKVRKRAGNRCEYDFADRHSGQITVDHFTSIQVARRIGMEKKVARSIDNAHLICDACNQAKCLQEREAMRYFDENNI